MHNCRSHLYNELLFLPSLYKKCERGNTPNVTICLLLLYLFFFLKKRILYIFVTHADGAVGAGFGAVPLPAVKEPRAASAQDPRKCPVIDIPK